MLIAIWTLFVASFTFIGLVAAWAATSPGHWFLRASLYVGFLALLLLIPAYEPFVAFAIQGAVVAVTIHFNRWRMRRIQRDGKNARWAFFTISSLLQATVFIAVAASIAVSMPALNMRGWANVVLIGVVSGIATVLAHWVALSKSPRWYVRVIVGLAVSTCVSMSLVWGDWFVLSLVDLFSSWPPDEFELPGTFQFLAYESTFHPPVVWVPIMAGVTAAVSAVLWLSLCTKIGWPIAVFRSTLVGDGSEQEKSTLPTGELARLGCLWERVGRGWRRSLPRCAYLLLIGLIMIPPVVIYFELMTPMPIPNADDPEPNGWYDFVAAGKMVENSAHLDIVNSFDIASISELSKAVAALAPVYVRCELGLQKPVRCQVDYKTSDLNMDASISFRTLGRALVARGRLAELEGRFDEAAGHYLESVQLGYATRRGGLVVDSMIGNACSGSGRRSLFECREQFSATQCSKINNALIRLEALAEPAQAFIRRDHVWSEHAFGWRGHLEHFLQQIAGSDYEPIYRSFEDSYRRELAEMRLLRISLAIQAHRITSGELPPSLDSLVPRYLPDIPADPFDLAEGPLHYRRNRLEGNLGDGYLLYSVGFDGNDDGGQVIDGAMYSSAQGDLLLETLYSEK